jgi:hypothetical protein
MVQKQNKKLRRTKGAIIVSIALATIFGVMQALETRSAISTSQVSITTTVADTISVSCSPLTIALGTLTPGAPVSGTTTCTTTTNANNGYNLAATRDDADTTLDKVSDATVNISDKTAWTSGTPNGATWSATGLGFRVKQTGTTAALYNSTWWGSDDTAPNAKYAGFPNGYQDIAQEASYSASSTAVVVETKLDVPSTQKSGAYDGTVTFQATSTP